MLADHIGQVRDVLAAAEPEGEPPIYPTIEAALATRPPAAAASAAFTGNG